MIATAARVDLFIALRWAAVLAAALLPAGPARGSGSDFHVSPSAEPPRWDRLDPYQFTITRAEFEEALRRVYSESESWKTTIAIHPDHADIRRSAIRRHWPPYRLNFAASDLEKRAPAEGGPFWRRAGALPALASFRHPLAGLKIAIDPGHIGGEWAKMEGRWFRIGRTPPVSEGELTLEVARRLEPLLTALGASVQLVRDDLEPVTSARPSDFVDEALEILRLQGVAQPEHSYESLSDPDKAFTVQWQSEMLFYRAREIRDRAHRVNEEFKPDLVLCLHFNAAAWGNPARPSLVSGNHLHVLCNGTCSLGEFSYDDIRCEIVLRLVQRIHEEEIPLCDTVARKMAEATGLPPYTYPSTNAKQVTGNPYLSARNLLANRAYFCPVVFLEPYVMNHREVFNRVQRAASEDPDIFDEYAAGVAAGLRTYYETRRKRSL